MSEHAAGQMAKWAGPYVSGGAIIRRAELQRLVPFSMVHIWRLEKRGEFPARVQLGENSIGWHLEEVQGWIESRIRAGGRAPKRREATDAANSSGKPGIAGEPRTPRFGFVRRAPLPKTPE
jgi:prophage regulatory protein